NNNNVNSGTSNNNSNNTGNNTGNNANSVPAVPVEVLQQDYAIYIVERNDSLWKIAVKFYGQGESWRTIYNDNRAVIKNPGRLYAGQRLLIRLPGATTAVPETPAPLVSVAVTLENTYVVQKGDMLWRIADKIYGDGKLWTVIYEANKDSIKNPECIRAGQVLNIPRTGDSR
ncbi:MAG: LysM peptidoglycan-binding domain-containing protein, partial [Acetatifactor sp.]